MKPHIKRKQGIWFCYFQDQDHVMYVTAFDVNYAMMRMNDFKIKGYGSASISMRCGCNDCFRYAVGNDNLMPRDGMRRPPDPRR